MFIPESIKHILIFIFDNLKMTLGGRFQPQKRQKRNKTNDISTIKTHPWLPWVSKFREELIEIKSKGLVLDHSV